MTILVGLVFAVGVLLAVLCVGVLAALVLSSRISAEEEE